MSTPLQELNLRGQHGGVVGSYKDVLVPPALQRRWGKVIVLVHGFKTSKREALKSWGVFQERLRMMSRPSAEAILCGVHWPGDHPWPLFSLATFSNRISDAEQTGDKLARVLWGLPAEQIIIVGHSLGCRAVLQALLQTKAESPPDAARISHAFLMAAAVGKNDCAGGKYDRSVLSDAVQVAFYSPRDRVLQGAFGVGTIPYNGLRGAAVGRRGEPVGRWDPKHSANTQLGHGGYWSSWSVAARIAEVLEINMERIPDTWHLSENEATPMEYRPAVHELAEWQPTL